MRWYVPHASASATSDSSSSREGNSPVPVLAIAFKLRLHLVGKRCDLRHRLHHLGMLLERSAERWRASRVLRRANSACTASRARDGVSGPRLLISEHERERERDGGRARARRTDAGSRTGRSSRTTRRAADSSRARGCRTARACAGCTSIQQRQPTHVTASSSRPPAHQPTSQHAASAGTSSRSVCSTGSSARSGVYGGTIRNAASARRSFPHPRSDGAGAASVLPCQPCRPRVYGISAR